MVSINEPRHEKTCLCHIRTTKARISLRSLISAFIVRCLDSIIPLFAISKISRLQLASVAEQAGLSLTWSQTPKTGFLVMWLKCDKCGIKFNLSLSLSLRSDDMMIMTEVHILSFSLSLSLSLFETKRKDTG